MKRLLAIVVLMLGMAGVVKAEQTITTADGVFSLTLPDGNVSKTDLGGGSMLYRVMDLNNTEAVGFIEVFDPKGTVESNTTQKIVDATLAGAKDSSLLTNVPGTLNGYNGREYSFTSTNDVGTRIITTARVWVSGTGTTLYTAIVVQSLNGRNDSRAQWFLNTATFHAENFR